MPLLLAPALLLALAPARSTMRQCTLAVNGKLHVNGRCLVFPMGGHGYTLNSWDKGKPRRSHFAVVDETRPGQGEASWNADPDDSRAGDSLGRVRWKAGCWVNARVRICAR
jgi:hypothetical protein